MVNYIKQTSNLRYILMEYLPSNLLDEHNREKTMHIAKVRTIMRDIFGGLEYLHDCGIIHRDIKMSNILLTYEKRAKICDFGMSVKLTDGRAAVIAAANACGTPNYMPPELCSTNGLLSTKADIWSSGVVMYAILVGVMPFGRRTDENVHLRILECSYEIPNYLRHHPEMQTAVDLLQQILVIEPFQRPSVQQLLNDRFFEMNSWNYLYFLISCIIRLRIILLLKTTAVLTPHIPENSKELYWREKNAIYDLYVYFQLISLANQILCAMFILYVFWVVI